MNYVLLLLPLIISACNPFDDKMTAACEKALSQRLLSPSSLHIISTSTIKRIETREEFASYLQKSGESEKVKGAYISEYNGGKPFYYHERLIEYDSNNAYGVPIRMTSTCEYEGWAENPEPSDFSVSIDGKTSTEWLIDQMRTP